MTKTYALILAALLVGITSTQSQAATMYDGITFPGGDASFADAVLRFDPLFSGGPGPTAPRSMDPTQALGAPDFVGSGATAMGSYSLGNGGLLEVLFTDNALSNSGTMDNDLHVFEVGPAVEQTLVAIRPTDATRALLGATNPSGGAFDVNGDGFFEVGVLAGATASVDIDEFFPGFGPGELVFDAVQVVDVVDVDGNSGEFVGGDIDAIGAIASAPAPNAVPEPTALMIWSLGVAGLGVGRRRRR